MVRSSTVYQNIVYNITRGYIVVWHFHVGVSKKQEPLCRSNYNRIIIFVFGCFGPPIYGNPPCCSGRWVPRGGGTGEP